MTTGLGGDAHAAFTESLDKLEKRVRRYKRRLKDHHKARPQPVELSDAGSYILALTEDADEGTQDDPNPVIIAEMEAKIPALSVGEAVMQMELANVPVLVFRNEKHSGVNVVYRRDDGNIGWIDPRNTG